jgi:hypothetical protein
MFLDLGTFFLDLHMFFLDLAQGGGNSDIETRCMQEDVERKGEHVDIEAR